MPRYIAAVEDQGSRESMEGLSIDVGVHQLLASLTSFLRCTLVYGADGWARQTWDCWTGMVGFSRYRSGCLEQLKRRALLAPPRNACQVRPVHRALHTRTTQYKLRERARPERAPWLACSCTQCLMNATPCGAPAYIPTDASSGSPLRRGFCQVEQGVFQDLGRQSHPPRDEDGIWPSYCAADSLRQ